MGGWDKCVGPFNYAHASEYGVSVTECNNNCYARLEKNGSKYTRHVTSRHAGKHKLRFRPIGGVTVLTASGRPIRTRASGLNRASHTKWQGS